MTTSIDTIDDTPSHDTLSVPVEEFDIDMHLYMCEVLYNNVDC